MAVVARVLLNHVHVDPLQRAGFATSSHAGVVQGAGRGCLSALFALRLPDRQVFHPVSAVERSYVTVLDVWVVPNLWSIGLTLEDPSEPGAFNLGHVTDETVEGEDRTGHRAMLAREVLDPFGFEQQRRAVELQPGLEQLAFG